jgi:uncharacterized protein YwqG
MRMDTSAALAALNANQLSAYTSFVDQLAQPSLLLTAMPTDDRAIPLGASRLGGLPDLPLEQAWPQLNSAPMSFLGQICLADTHGLDGGAALPATGLLSFFYDATQQTFGSNPHDRAGLSVLYFSDTAVARLNHVAAWPAGLPARAQFKPAAVMFSPVMTYAQDLQAEFPSKQIAPQDQQRFEDALAQLSSAPGTTPRHRLLGHPDTIQDDMRQQVEFAANGLADPSADPAKAKALALTANQWRLLLQIDSDNRLGMRWASSGMLYTWIRQSDLASGNFSACWPVLQSE